MKARSTLSAILSLILALSLTAPARAAYQVQATQPGDPNPTRRELTYEETQALYVHSVGVAVAAQGRWPDGGSVSVTVSGRYTLSELNGATIPAGLLVDVYQVSGSQYRFLVRYDTRDGKPLTVTDASADAKNGAPVAGFDDVSSSDYYAQAVQWAVNAGVTTGTGANTFSPDNTVTRAEAVTFLWRAAGSPEPASAASPFADVTDPSAYYYDAVLWAAEQGITGGVGNNAFGLTGTLAYDQILTFLCRAAGEDAGGADWSAAAVSWAADSGLTDGLDFAPKDSCPRSDVVYCLWKQMAGDGESQASGDTEGARAAIEQSLLNMETAIDVSAYGIEAGALLDLAEDIVNVEDFYEPFTGYYGVTGLWCLEEAGQTARTLYAKYGNTPEGIRQQRDIVVKAWEILDETLEPGMSDYEIAKALHDYVVLNTAYGFPDNVPRPTAVYSGYFSLLWGCGVCTDYAMAYQLLMDMAGVPCEVVTNDTHAWNVVQIDGEWYHVDTTWDDPTPNREGYVRYNYFLKSDAYMSRDHQSWSFNGTSYACTSTKYDNTILPEITG